MTRKSAKGAKKISVRRSVKTARGKARPSEKSQLKIFPIVGIGASAGGVEASSELVSRLSPNLSMAYVFIHHLSPDYKSNLTAILQRHTNMPVIKVTQGTEVLPGHVYVIPPGTFMGLEEGHLRLKERSKRDIPYHPIDYFFISLADGRHGYAIGILLSGTATDGTLGLKAIKDAGGITMVQDESAIHRQMPENAEALGYVDFVLRPQRMAEELVSLNGHPFVEVSAEEEVTHKEKSIEKILNVVLNKTGVDFFSHYKRTTVFRRIMRRMALLKIPTWSGYVKKVNEDDREADALYHDFLINVTSFFREPAFYNALGKSVFPRIIKDLKPAEPVRIWIAGCATGEEAYSTAICLAEFLQKKQLSNPVHIFSTDLNGKAIEKARAGIYAKGFVQHISPQRLKKFFVKINGHYRVIKSIREMCVFSQHNLLKDPPFSRIDLISCQNVMIYLETPPQRRIFKAFHYALKSTGFLLLGKSESIGTVSDLFQSSEQDARLFAKKAVATQRLDFGSHRHSVSPATVQHTSSIRIENDVEKESDKLLLSRYVPPSVLVNKNLEIIRFRGATAAYLEPPQGKASLSLVKMIKDELLFDLRAAIQQAKKTGLPAVQENMVPGRKTGIRISIEVAPIRSGKEVFYLVVFKEVPDEPELPKKKASKRGEQNAKIQKLEQALANAREQIRATGEEFEGTREELQSANEEILSSNEELQSINEELETSKEELQSSNEELTTINDELQNRNIELNQARDYAEAIIQTMRGPLMVLNAEMRVRTANRAFYQFFGLHEEDTEGTLIYELGNRQWNIPALLEQLQDIFPRKADFKDFVIHHHFTGIGFRAMIVNAHRLIQDEEGRESLILLSFEDITRYVQAEQSLLETQEKLKLALEGGSVGIWVWDLRTNKMKVSADDEKRYGMSEGLSLKTIQEWEKAIHPLDRNSTRRALRRSIKHKMPLDVEFRIVCDDGSTRWILAKGNTYYDARGKAEKMMGIRIDITERRTAVEALQESERRFHTMSDQAPVMIWMAGPDAGITFVNKTSLSFTGRTLEAESGEGWFDGIHPEDKDVFFQVYRHAYENRKEFKIDYRFKHHNGEYRWLMNRGIPRFAGDDIFLGFIGTCVDITDRIELERQKDDFMGIASHELKTPVTSIKAYAQILQDKFRRASDEVSASMLTRLDHQIDKLTGLINTLLDVAKVQSGQMDYFNDFFDIDSFVAEVVEELQRTSRDHKIVSHVETTGNIYGDKARLGQVLTNLLSNAIKYSPNGGEVIVHVARDRDRYVFMVQDFGVGISKDMQEKIFGRFFRVSESEGNRVSGLGLGLFISSQIVKQQGGNLWVESERGKGSKFYFSFPVKE